MFILRDEADECIIEGVGANTIVEDIKGVMGNITAYNVPISLKKFCTQTIWTRGTIALKLVDSLVNLYGTKILVKKVIHLGADPVDNPCYSFSSVGGVRGRKNVGEVIHQLVLNFPIISNLAALLISDEVYSVFSLSLRSFEMKKLRVFVSLLKPISFGSLGPPCLFLVEEIIQI
jgi:hypothetical protein